MKTNQGIYWGLFLVLALVNVFGPREWFVWTKPALVPGIAFGFQSLIRSSPRSNWLWVALFFGWVGDVLLLFPSLFLGGLGAFLLGHLAYVVLMYPSMAGPWKGRVPMLLFAGLMGFQLYSHVAPALIIPVLLYMSVICFMALVAFRQGQIWLTVGSLLFMFSDLVLAWNKFINPLPAGGIVVMITYISAQFALVKGWTSKQVSHIT
ncbi:MAG: lysoplasmalogenase [Spirosomataceae bacterium]